MSNGVAAFGDLEVADRAIRWRRVGTGEKRKEIVGDDSDKAAEGPVVGVEAEQIEHGAHRAGGDERQAGFEGIGNAEFGEDRAHAGGGVVQVVERRRRRRPGFSLPDSRRRLIVRAICTISSWSLAAAMISMRWSESTAAGDGSWTSRG